MRGMSQLPQAHLQCGVPRKFCKWQPCATVLSPVGANRNRSQKQRCARSRYQIVLVNTVATDSNRADEHSVAVKRKSSRKNRNAIGEVAVHLGGRVKNSSVHGICKQNVSSWRDRG